MNRRLLLSFLASSLLTTGCFGGIAEGLAEGVGKGIECVGVAFGKALGGLFTEPIRSDGGDYQLYGICNIDEPCERAVMLGAELSLWVDGAESQAVDGEALVSGSPSAVTIVENVSDCGIPAAAIATTSTGQASIALSDGITIVDTFSFEVAEAATMWLGYGDVDGPESISLAPEQTTIVSARIHDADDRPLAAGSAVRWSSSDPAIVSFVDDDDLGQGVQLEAGQAGQATITAEVAGLSASVVVEVSGES